MAIRNLLTRGIGFAPAGVNFLVTHGFSSGAVVEPPAPAQIVSGGVIIVAQGAKKKRKKKTQIISAESRTIQADIEALPDVSRVISAEEAAGMAAFYGARMQPVVPENEPVFEEPKAIFESIDIQESAFYEPEVLTENVDRLLLDQKSIDEEDEIALILAIIEAIG